MKKWICVIALLMGIIITIEAQIYVDKNGNVYDGRQKKNTSLRKTETASSGFKFDPSKLTFGGNVGFQFGDYTSINVSPQVGYDFSNYFNAGLGVGYTYYRDKYWSGGDGYKLANTYVGMNVYARFYPVDYLVISVQPEGNRLWKTVKLNGNKVHDDTKFVGSVIIGGGIRYGYAIAMIQYDLVQDKDSPYGDTIFYTVGFSF